MLPIFIAAALALALTLPGVRNAFNGDGTPGEKPGAEAPRTPTPSQPTPKYRPSGTLGNIVGGVESGASAAATDAATASLEGAAAAARRLVGERSDDAPLGTGSEITPPVVASNSPDASADRDRIPVFTPAPPRRTAPPSPITETVTPAAWTSPRAPVTPFEPFSPNSTSISPPVQASYMTNSSYCQRYGAVPTRNRCPSRGHVHRGVDLEAPGGAAVRAVEAGTITRIGNVRGAGYRIILRTDDGVEWVYRHLNGYTLRNFSIGQRVTRGQKIGEVASEGPTMTGITGEHLHIERLVGGLYTDPTPFLFPDETLSA